MKDWYSDESSFTRVKLDVLQLHVQRHVRESELHNVSFEKYASHVADEMVYRLSTRIATGGIREISYPKDWWQAVKVRWFPAWLLKKYPAMYTTHEAVALYPDIEIPNHKPHVEFFVREDQPLFSRD
jgi:hypothetical protein